MALVILCRPAPYIQKDSVMIRSGVGAPHDQEGLEAEEPRAIWPKADSMNRRELILAVLAAADGRPYTPSKSRRPFSLFATSFRI
jgi:hypothetical protein